MSIFLRIRSLLRGKSADKRASNINRTRFGLILECMTHHLEYLQSLFKSESYDINDYLYFSKPKCEINVTEGGNNVNWGIKCGHVIFPYG